MGEGSAGGQTGEGLNAVAAKREDDSHTATLLPQCQCFCLEPFPGPPAEVAHGGAEGKNLLQASGANQSPFNKALSQSTLVNRNIGGEEKQSLFFLFYLVNN